MAEHVFHEFAVPQPIVQALAKQLQASVEVASGNPGTKVSIEHTQIALVDEDQ
jgi:two-component system, sensor histidine kinase PdtaS